MFVIILYKLLPHIPQNRMLLVASYFFYAYWDWRFLSLIALSAVINYFTVISIVKAKSQRRRKNLLIISICGNLSILGSFKYYNFFVSEFIKGFGFLDLGLHLPILDIVLPVGISFYTFQAMGCAIDVYRGTTQPNWHFLDFALFVAFFPLLLAGPIERSSRLMPQIVNPRSGSTESFSIGLYYILMGLFKKVVVADNMAPIVNMIFSADSSKLSGADCLIGVYAFAFQLYGDFSGYSSIAKGIAKWLGFDIMENFSMPYFSTSPRDFWRRWHISLSSWFRDYVYIPFGGNRLGKFINFRNLMFTMTLCGLWHGANWTFICWGVFHGLLLIGYQIFVDYRKISDLLVNSFLSRAIKALVMFHLVCIGWLMFRAESIPQAWMMLNKMVTDFHVTEFTWFSLGMIGFYVVPLLMIELWIERSGDLLKLIKVHWVVRSSIYGYVVLMLVIFQPITPQQFIYFRF